MAGGVGRSEGLERGEVTPTTAKKWDTHKMWRQKTDNKTLSFVLSGLIRGLGSHLGALASEIPGNTPGAEECLRLLSGAGVGPEGLDTQDRLKLLSGFYVPNTYTTKS